MTYKRSFLPPNESGWSQEREIVMLVTVKTKFLGLDGGSVWNLFQHVVINNFVCELLRVQEKLASSPGAL